MKFIAVVNLTVDGNPLCFQGHIETSFFPRNVMLTGMKLEGNPARKDIVLRVVDDIASCSTGCQDGILIMTSTHGKEVADILAKKKDWERGEGNKTVQDFDLKTW